MGVSKKVQVPLQMQAEIEKGQLDEASVEC
jgi:hypothetical protein